MNDKIKNVYPYSSGYKIHVKRGAGELSPKEAKKVADKAHGGPFVDINGNPMKMRVIVKYHTYRVCYEYNETGEFDNKETLPGANDVRRQFRV